MSFISNIFKGATSDYTPGRAFKEGTQAQTTNFNPVMAQGQADYSHAQGGFDALTAALQQQMNGGGPNLANQQLQNATGQNVANQAALMAGQRGAGSNVGLMSRQIGQQGANIQQQAAGQAATNRLQQQLSAQQQLGSALGTQGQLANQYYGTAVQGQGNQNNAIMGDIQGVNKMGQQQNQFNAAANQQLISGVANAGAMMLADGGMPAAPSPLGNYGKNAQVLQLDEGNVQPQFSMNFSSGKKPKDPMSGAQDVTSQMSPTSMMAVAAKGGSVNHLPFAPHDYRGGGAVKASNPQQKATVPGNSYANDKIPAMVSEGEFVVNRDIMQSPNAPELAAAAIRKALSKGKR